MGNKDKVNMDKLNMTVASVKAKCITNWKVIAGVVVVVIIVLNTFWNMMDSRITETITKEIGAFKTSVAELETRVAETEKGSHDPDSVKADIASMKKAGEDFEAKLSSVIKAEENKLATLEKDVEAQKAYLNGLKTLLSTAAE